MKTPITYYGGKQTMLKHILPLIPKHKVYTETFLGGGAVLWAKDPAPLEIVNDYREEFNPLEQVQQECLRALRTGRPGL